MSLKWFKETDKNNFPETPGIWFESWPTFVQIIEHTMDILRRLLLVVKFTRLVCWTCILQTIFIQSKIWYMWFWNHLIHRLISGLLYGETPSHGYPSGSGYWNPGSWPYDPRPLNSWTVFSRDVLTSINEIEDEGSIGFKIYTDHLKAHRLLFVLQSLTNYRNRNMFYRCQIW